MPDCKPALNGHVFLLTYGRSGSTLLQRLMNAVPGVLVRGENNNALYPLFQSWRALNDSPDIGRMRTDGLISDAAHPWFGAEQIDTDAYGRALCACFAAQVLRPPPGTRLCGFKEIRTISDPARFRAYLAFMQRFFPAARFVFNTRDPQAVARSSWWRRHDPDEVRAMIAAAEQVFREFAAAHPQTSVMLHYDDYTTDHRALAPLFALLGDHPPDGAVQAIMAERLTHAT